MDTGFQAQKKTSVEVHLHAFGAKAGLAFTFNLLKINVLIGFALGICPQNGT
ncbi:TPA: hypothetical protein MB376_005529 [Klebsiella pneumoniae]|uniref:hypothetical protein n=1 Tax=Klebsiella pneumoniae complex TaxID=3390273 RepID=UPI0013EF0BC1|nr:MULTISPECIES: hypothetical protein [Klebsiella]HCI6137996.1 hypothetical protein [Klebsiella variicola subsp. variicola]ELI8924543.1 hypothetical protein [Klebsiella pneumoniae]ELI8927463.1 hypothetical protein [Klebsiella pneumoniae]MCP6556369.1 hypothetical protein [Klebsiella pneumoniae]MEB6444873.1 hypothetical protein [Klebsiella variicola]